MNKLITQNRLAQLFTGSGVDWKLDGNSPRQSDQLLTDSAKHSGIIDIIWVVQSKIGMFAYAQAKDSISMKLRDSRPHPDQGIDYDVANQVDACRMPSFSLSVAHP